MENTKITITPLYFSYTHGHPHPHKQQLSVLLKFKRILHSTGHELEKFQCKKTFPFPHNHTINTGSPSILDLKHFKTQTAINFQLVKEMELSNTRVDIIVIGLLNLGKDVNLLGIASLDLGLFDEVDLQKQQFKREMNIKLDKCDDPGAFMHVEVCLKRIEPPKRVENRKLENVEPMGMLETEGFQKQSLMLNRRKNRDFPTAYEISHRNYKQAQITRTEEFSISPQTKANQKLQRSYKKRFQYQYEVSTKRIAKNKDAHKGISNVNKTAAGTQRNSPSPRLKTPEPIKQSSTLKNKFRDDSKQSKKHSTPSYQNIAKNKPLKAKKQSISKSHVTERPVQKQSKRFQYSENEEQRQDGASNHYTNSPPSGQLEEEYQVDHFYTKKNAKVQESPDIETVNENRFRMITQKFERIDQQLMEKTPAYKDKKIEPEIKSFDQIGDQISSDNLQQFSEEQDEMPRKLIEPLPYRQKSDSSENPPNVYESQVDHYSPSNSSKLEKQVKKKDKDGEGVTFFESEAIKIESPSKQKQSQINREKIESLITDEKFQRQKQQPISNKKPKEENDYQHQQSPLQKRSGGQRDFMGQNNSIKKYTGKKQKQLCDSSVKSEEKASESQKQKEQNKPQMIPHHSESSEIKNEHQREEVKVQVEAKTKPNRMGRNKQYQEENTVEDHKECEQRIGKLENQLEEQEEEFRKLLMEKDLECKKKVKQEQERVAIDFNQMEKLRENDLKQKSLIDKLNQMYEESDDKNFQLSKDYEKKCMEYERKVDALTKKNESLQASVENKDKDIEKYEKKIKELTSELADVKEKIANMVMAQNERILQEKEPFSNMEGSERDSKKSEKGQMSNISSISCSEDNFKEGYINIKKKCVNLEAEIKYKENEIRFLKIKNDNLLQEKKDLENQIDAIVANNKHEMARQGSISKMNLESQSITNSFKLENKALKEEISNLQTQVHELNQIFEGLIKMDQLSMKSAMKKEQDRKKHQDEINDVILFKKYKALESKAEAYEQQVREKQQTIAKIINLVWAYGNRPLMEEIGKLIIGKQAQF